MDMENKKLELKIPEKVSDHQYVIQGIGKHEMTILVIQFLAAIGLLLICAIFGNITIGLFIGAAIVIITFFLLIRDKGDTSQSLANTDDNWTDASSDTAASLVWGNVFVQEVFDSAGAVISTSDSTTPAQRVNIYMDNDNVAAFYAALAQGSLRVVKICE